MTLDRARLCIFSILMATLILTVAVVAIQGALGHYGSEHLDLLTGHLKLTPWYLSTAGALLWILAATAKADDPARVIRVGGLFWVCLAALVALTGLLFFMLILEARINLPPGDFLTLTSLLLSPVQLLVTVMIGKLITAK